MSASVCLGLLLLLWRISQSLSVVSSSSSYSLRSPLSTVISSRPASSVSSQSSSSSVIPETWIHGDNQEGEFLDVEDILKDPRTTKDTSHLDIIAREMITERHITRPMVPDQEPSQEPVKNHQPRVKNNLMMLHQNDVNNEDFKSVMNYNSHFKPHVTKDLFKSGFTVERSDACRNTHDEDILLTIIVISAPDHFDQRQAIRSSWGGSGPGVVFTFLVGLSDDKRVADEVMNESDKYKDMVINKITDLYQNLSLKTLSAFNWVVNHCPKSSFLLKVDDDMFVQVDKIIKKIQMIKDPHPRLILGNISRNWKPVRNPQSKYLINEAQYPETTYPDFATGPSYLVSREAVAEILEAAMDMNYIHLEDVFLTGVVADSLGIQRLDENEFKNNAVRVPAQFMGCTIERSVTIHKVSPEEQLELFKLSKHPNCGKPNKQALADQTKKLLKNAIKTKGIQTKMF